MKRARYLVIAFLLVTGLVTLLAQKILPRRQTFYVESVVDGDTIKLQNGTRIRYIGTDTPEMEKGQRQAECYAKEAKKINEGLVLNRPVRVEKDLNEMDRFGRTLAYVFVKTENGQEIFVNQWLLKEGAGKFLLDTVNLKYQPALVAAAESAHANKKGLWLTCAPEPKAGCQIKGNVGLLDQRFYHLSDFRHYEQTKVNLIHGDQWFCTETEAQEAGFKKARE